MGTPGSNPMRRLTALTICIVLFLLFGGSPAAQAGDPTALAADRAWDWLEERTEIHPQDPVDHLFLPFFALNVCQNRALGHRIKKVLIRRLHNISKDGWQMPPQSYDRLMKQVVTAYVLEQMGVGTNNIRGFLNNPKARSAIKTILENNIAILPDPLMSNHLMLLFMLESLGLSPPGGYGRFAENYQERFFHLLKKGGLQQQKQFLYFLTHLIFARSALGAEKVSQDSLIKERIILRQEGERPEVFSDNDLWPEIYLALVLAGQCPAPFWKDHLESLARAQEVEGSFTPTTLGEDSRLHTTAVMFLALQAQPRCSTHTLRP